MAASSTSFLDTSSRPFNAASVNAVFNVEMSPR